MRMIMGSAVVGIAALALACADAPRREADRARGPRLGDTAAHLAIARQFTRDDGRGARQCTGIRGYLDDPAPGGRRVHAAPDAGSPVLGRIAEPLPEANGGWAVGFAINSSRDGWLQIEGAGDDSQLSEGMDRPMYHGAGWIRGNGVSVTVQATQAFSEPRHSGPIVLRVIAPEVLDGTPAALRQVVACDGAWILGRWEIREPARVRYSPGAVVSTSPLVVEAWATGICNIQETSCDGLSGDRPDSVHPDPTASSASNEPRARKKWGGGVGIPAEG
jgi:hypothetical protein